jgi:hypothetical protein
MAFSNETILKAWEESGGRCECREKHNHPYGRCPKILVFGNRGRSGRGCWEAHHISPNGGDRLSNCEILCCECYSRTL